MSSSRLSPFKHHKAMMVLRGVLALLVIGLGILALRSDWHASFHAFIEGSDHLNHGSHACCGDPQHDTEQDHDDSGCAIQLFASGHVEVLQACMGPQMPPQESVLSRLPIRVGPCADLGLVSPGRSPPSLN